MMEGSKITHELEFLLGLFDDEEEKSIIKALSQMEYSDKDPYEKIIAELLGVKDDDRV